MHNTGYPEIDHDHHMIAETIKLLSSELNYLDQDFRHALFEKILDYAIYHLNREERLMNVMGFPDFQEHCRAHEELQDTFLQFAKPALRGELDQQELVKLLHETFLTHINTLDSEFITWVKEHRH